MDFFKTIIKDVKNPYASVASEGIIAGDINGYTGSGSYTLNALLSGRTDLGFPNGKVTALAGDPGSGKTFILVSTMKEFLDANPEGAVFLFETESAITKKMLEERGIDTERVYVFPVATVEEFKFQVVKILDTYNEQPIKQRKPLLIGLDSLGMLSTEKEMGDASDGKMTKDMTRAQLVKGVFRIITLKLGLADIPMIITNHTYDSMGLFSKKEMSGGSGPKYAASTIIFLSKRQDVKGSSVIVTAMVDKGRLTIEKSKAEIFIDFKAGLSKWHGVVDVAVEIKAITKTGHRFYMGEVMLANGKTAMAKACEDGILEKYPEVLKAVDEHLHGLYTYGEEIDLPDDGDTDTDE